MSPKACLAIALVASMPRVRPLGSLRPGNAAPSCGRRLGQKGDPAASRNTFRTSAVYTCRSELTEHVRFPSCALEAPHVQTSNVRESGHLPAGERSGGVFCARFSRIRTASGLSLGVRVFVRTRSPPFDTDVRSGISAAPSEFIERVRSPRARARTPECPYPPPLAHAEHGDERECSHSCDMLGTDWMSLCDGAR